MLNPLISKQKLFDLSQSNLSFTQIPVIKLQHEVLQDHQTYQDHSGVSHHYTQLVYEVDTVPLAFEDQVFNVHYDSQHMLRFSDILTCPAQTCYIDDIQLQEWVKNNTSWHFLKIDYVKKVDQDTVLQSLYVRLPPAESSTRYPYLVSLDALVFAWMVQESHSKVREYNVKIQNTDYKGTEWWFTMTGLHIFYNRTIDQAEVRALFTYSSELNNVLLYDNIINKKNLEQTNFASLVLKREYIDNLEETILKYIAKLTEIGAKGKHLNEGSSLTKDNINLKNKNNVDSIYNDTQLNEISDSMCDVDQKMNNILNSLLASKHDPEVLIRQSILMIFGL